MKILDKLVEIKIKEYDACPKKNKNGLKINYERDKQNVDFALLMIEILVLGIGIVLGIRFFGVTHFMLW